VRGAASIFRRVAGADGWRMATSRVRVRPGADARGAKEDTSSGVANRTFDHLEAATPARRGPSGLSDHFSTIAFIRKYGARLRDVVVSA
jgi:hypothetical protein